MFAPQIRILKSDPKWTNFIYVASSARSRMLTNQISKKVEKNEIEVVNPEVLFDTGINTAAGIES